MKKINIKALEVIPCGLLTLLILGSLLISNSWAHTNNITVGTQNVIPADSVPNVQNGLAKTPPMGWNSWNHFGCNINENIIKQMADAMAASGMKAAGYKYIIIDDCWMADHRNSKGQLVPDPERFPHGIKWLADYVHSKGLKLGIYESAGTVTCQGYPGSLHHVKTDAKSFARWGVDFLKYDNCGNQGINYIMRYSKMAKALKATGRPIVYSVCEWGVKAPWNWAPQFANEWRTTGDIRANWNSIMSILDQQVGLYQYAGPGHWNNPDMLEVGNKGSAFKADTVLTLTESKAQFSLWAILAAPLIAGNDLRQMNSKVRNILENQAVIAVDQDPAGKQGYKAVDNGDQEVWVKPLSDGSTAVLLLNRGPKRVFMTATVEQAGLPKADYYKETNLWKHQSKRIDDLIRSSVPSHGVAMFRVWPEQN